MSIGLAQVAKHISIEVHTVYTWIQSNPSEFTILKRSRFTNHALLLDPERIRRSENDMQSSLLFRDLYNKFDKLTKCLIAKTLVREVSSDASLPTHRVIFLRQLF